MKEEMLLFLRGSCGIERGERVRPLTVQSLRCQRAARVKGRPSLAYSIFKPRPQLTTDEKIEIFHYKAFTNQHPQRGGSSYLCNCGQRGIFFNKIKNLTPEACRVRQIF